MRSRSREQRAGVVLAAVFALSAVFVVTAFADRDSGSDADEMASSGADGETSSPETLAAGRRVYEDRCQICHGREGAGGVAPGLSGGAGIERFPDFDDMVDFVFEGSQRDQTYGEGGQGTGGMPPWENVLSEAEVRAVVAYERSL